MPISRFLNSYQSNKNSGQAIYLPGCSAVCRSFVCSFVCTQRFSRSPLTCLSSRTFPRLDQTRVFLRQKKKSHFFLLFFCFYVKCFKIPKNAPKCYKMPNNTNKISQMFPIDSICPKMLQNCSKTLQNYKTPKLSKML